MKEVTRYECDECGREGTKITIERCEKEHANSAALEAECRRLSDFTTRDGWRLGEWEDNCVMWESGESTSLAIEMREVRDYGGATVEWDAYDPQGAVIAQDNHIDQTRLSLDPLKAIRAWYDRGEKEDPAKTFGTVPPPRSGDVWLTDSGWRIALDDYSSMSGEWSYSQLGGAGFGFVRLADWNARAVKWRRLDPDPWGPVPEEHQAAVMESTPVPHPPASQSSAGMTLMGWQ